MKEANKILKFINFIFFTVIGMFLFIDGFFIIIFSKDYLSSVMLFIILPLTYLISTALIKRYEFSLKETEMPLIIGLFISAIAFLSLIFIRSSAGLIFTQITIGIGAGIYMPAYLILLKYHDGKTINKTKELVTNLVITIAGMMLAGLLVLFLSLKLILLIMTSLYIFASVFTLLLPRKIL